MTRFEDTVVREVRRLGVDGVVCGHIHRPEIRTIDGILYANDGDWVENCTALAEDAAGRLEILSWARTENPSIETVRPARDLAYA